MYDMHDWKITIASVRYLVLLFLIPGNKTFVQAVAYMFANLDSTLFCLQPGTKFSFPEGVLFYTVLVTLEFQKGYRPIWAFAHYLVQFEMRKLDNKSYLRNNDEYIWTK